MPILHKDLNFDLTEGSFPFCSHVHQLSSPCVLVCSPPIKC